MLEKYQDTDIKEIEIKGRHKKTTKAETIPQSKKKSSKKKLVFQKSNMEFNIYLYFIVIFSKTLFNLKASVL